MTQRRHLLKFLLVDESMVRHADILLGALRFPSHRGEVAIKLDKNEVLNYITVLSLYNIYRESHRSGVASPFKFKKEVGTLYQQYFNLDFINEIQTEILEEGISSMPEWKRFLRKKFNPNVTKKIDKIIYLEEKIEKLEKRIQKLENKINNDETNNTDMNHNITESISPIPSIIINKKRGLRRRYRY